MSLFYPCVPKILIWSTVLERGKQHNRLKYVILGHFLPFYSYKKQKNQNFEMIKIPGDIILHVYQKSQSYDVLYIVKSPKIFAPQKVPKNFSCSFLSYDN